MKGLLAVSSSDPARPAGRAGLPEAAARHLAGADEAVTHRTGDGWVTLAAPGPDDRVAGAAETFTVRLTNAVRGSSGDVPVATLAGWLADPDRPDRAGLSGLLPPFAAAHRERPGGPVVLAGDWLGARQLFWWQGDGIAAVSTSALALGALTGAGLDRAGLGVQSLLGWQLGTGTIFAGVHKLPPGCLAVLAQGRVRLQPYAEPETIRPERHRADGDRLAAEIADLLRAFHEAYLADHPDAVLQLSGGLDSRLLLSAMPSGRRRGLAAFTLDVRGGAEARVASRLAERCGLTHRTYYLDEQPPAGPVDAYALVRSAAVALDCMASPLALAPLARFEAGLSQGQRLTGTGGEVARGFYYPGQPRQATVSPALVERLARWRLFTNEAVPGEVLEPEFAEAAQSTALDRITARLTGYGPQWLPATDEFYLFDRVQRWAGAHATVAAVARESVNPLLDRRFVQLAMAGAPADKRSSGLVGRVVTRLDPLLAAVPLDSGQVPARLDGSGLVGYGRRQLVTGRKVAGKVRQRLRGRRPAQLGAAGLAQLVVRHWQQAPETVAPLRACGLVHDQWLDRLLSGAGTAAPATVAFLVNLLVAGEAAGARTG